MGKVQMSTLSAVVDVLNVDIFPLNGISDLKCLFEIMACLYVPSSKKLCHLWYNILLTTGGIVFIIM